MDQKRNEQDQQSQDLDREPAEGSEDVIGRGTEQEADEQDDLQDDDDDFSQSER